ncbi:MAG: hypothetical protein HY614_10345 [Candidatus Rokubacteria bacterium]|nr:hypothetical protein [Candidatus Rokubacteria bacterium]
MAFQHRRMPFMALGALSLLAALWAGLIRLGWALPPITASVPPHHGPLMVTGFLGTVIGLERAVALQRRWPYAAPFLTGLGGLAWIIGMPDHVGHALAAAGSVFLVAIFVVLYRRHPAIYLASMGVGALTWLAGTVLWHMGEPLYRVAPWWIGFLVLTIAGERREISRLMRLGAWRRAGFVGAGGLFLSGLLAGLTAPEFGVRLAGIGLVALAVWLLRNDIAWRTVRQAGLPRYMALCLLPSYVWLGVGGLLWVRFADRFTAGPLYDAMLHSIFLGFVFPMIFGHAPIILPSVLGIALPFRPAFYAHLALLHLSVLARVSGDLGFALVAPAWSGLASVLAILLFLVNSLRAVRLGREA